MSYRQSSWPQVHQATIRVLLFTYTGNIDMNSHVTSERKLLRMNLVFHAPLHNVYSGKRQSSQSILEKYYLLDPSLFTFIT